MSEPDPMSATGAVWCEKHRRWECKHNSKRTHLRCHANAIRGTAACVSHAGKVTELAKAQGEAFTAWSALGGKPAVSTVQAVLGMLQMSWLRAHLYAGLLERQFTDAQDRRRLSSRADAFYGDDADVGIAGSGAPPVGAGVGLIGHTYGAVKDIGIYASGEAIRGLVQLEAQERDRCVKYAKTAHDMGIAEQEIRVAEEQGALLAEAVRRICESLLTSLLALLGEQARADLPMDGLLREQFSAVVTAAVRSAWPTWLGEIVPREFRAISSGVER
ncbi:MAG: pas58 [Gemmatimonadales bacterium]|nr:pas58 [Gemmatimonadales bacterium]